MPKRSASGITAKATILNQVRRRSFAAVGLDRSSGGRVLEILSTGRCSILLNDSSLSVSDGDVQPPPRLSTVFHLPFSDKQWAKSGE
jgi:hypothetical protein